MRIALFSTRNVFPLLIGFLALAAPSFAAPPTKEITTSKPTKENASSKPTRNAASSKPTQNAASSKPTKENAAEDTVVVTASRRAQKLKDTVTQTEVITRQDILRTSAQRLTEILETHLGIQLTTPAGAGVGVQIQGLDSKYVLILLDGQRITGRLRGVLDLDRFPLEQIERIEIVKGATSALYGSDAIGGVINLITRTPKRPLQTSANLRYGYSDGHLLDLMGTLSGRWKGWSGSASVSFTRHDSYDLDKTTPSTTGSEEQQFQANAMMRYRFSHRAELSIQGEYQLRDLHGLDSNSVGGIFDRKNRTEMVNTSLFLNVLVGPMIRLRWRTSFSFFRDQFLYAQRGGLTPPTLQETYDWLIQSVLQADKAFGDKLFLSVGIEGLYEFLETQRLQEKNAERARIGLFSQLEWLLPTPIRISLVPGFRAEYDTQFGPAISPKLALRIDPIKSMAIRVSYGWGFRAPDFRELYLQFSNVAANYIVVGNNTLQPEFSRSLQAGIEWSALSWLTIRANFYRNDLENLINTEFLPTPPGSPLQITYTNVSAALTQGVESQIVIAQGRWLQLSLGYTFLHGEDRDTGKPLPLRASHLGNFQFFLHIPKTPLRLTLRGSFVGPRPIEQDREGTGTPQLYYLDPYLLLHARLSYMLWQERIEIFFSVNNILDAGDAAWLPIRPRTFFTGLRFHY